jgi:hypothetical protein
MPSGEVHTGVLWRGKREMAAEEARAVKRRVVGIEVYILELGGWLRWD